MSMSPPALYFTLTLPRRDQLFELLSPEFQCRGNVPGGIAVDEGVPVCFQLDGLVRSRRRYGVT